jgi:hypothetical protein
MGISLGLSRSLTSIFHFTLDFLSRPPPWGRETWTKMILRQPSGYESRSTDQNALKS